MNDISLSIRLMHSTHPYCFNKNEINLLKTFQSLRIVLMKKGYSMKMIIEKEYIYISLSNYLELYSYCICCVLEIMIISFLLIIFASMNNDNNRKCQYDKLFVNISIMTISSLTTNKSISN
jgi:hypothetical protein